jgi:hypothetical protein
MRLKLGQLESSWPSFSLARVWLAELAHILARLPVVLSNVLMQGDRRIEGGSVKKRMYF